MRSTPILMALPVALLALGTTAAAEDPPRTPQRAAEAAAAAFEAGDLAALRALAGERRPERWLVVDELLSRGNGDAAAAFASATNGKDVARLPAYVEARRGAPDAAAARRALAAAEAALRARNASLAREILDGADADPSTIVGVRLLETRGAAHQLAGRPKEAAEGFVVAADAAERLGWLTAVSSALELALTALFLHRDPRAYRALAERRLALESSREFAPGIAAARTAIGLAHQMVGDHASARAAYEEAVAMQEQLGDRHAAARTRGNLAGLHLSRGDYASAVHELEGAIEAFRALDDAQSATGALGNLGAAYAGLGEYAKARSALAAALDASERQGDRAAAARNRGNLAAVEGMVGNYRAAMAQLEVTWKEKVEVGDRAGAAATLGNIGHLQRVLGDYAKALVTLERALEQKRAVGDRAGAAQTLVHLGITHRLLGDPARALDDLRQALALQEALGDRRSVAGTLGSVALAHHALGDHEAALELLQRALVEREAVGDRKGAAEALGNLGNFLHVLGDLPKAVSLYERALAARLALGDRGGAALMRTNLGAAHHMLGNHAHALALFDEVMADLDALGERSGVVVTRTNRARTREALGDASGAVEDARAGVAELVRLMSGLAQDQATTAREQHADLFDAGVRAAATTGRPDEVAYFLEMGRAGALLDSFQARDALRNEVLSPALLTAEAEARAKEAAAVKAYRRAQDTDDLAVLRVARTEMEAARRATLDVTARIQREAKLAASLLCPEAASLEAIAATLAPDEAMVLYALTATKAYALVVRAGERRLVPLAPTSTIRAAAEALDLADRDTDPVAGLAALATHVVAPLALPPAVRTVLVSPHGPLASVPFQALLPGRDVACVPSGTVFALLRGGSSPSGTRVLALGDPDYGTERNDPPPALATRGGSLRFAPLPGTRAEAEAVGDVVLLGRDASEAELARALRGEARWRAVHLACHGVVDAERPDFCFLALTPDADNDGLLTTLDVFRSKVPADLAVLSACETGRGLVLRSEGIVGLTRAFLFAGTPRVVCSLWKVDDDATRALMTRFYELWAPRPDPGAPPGSPRGRGLPTARALREAQAHVAAQAKWKHPYYWAAWVLWGLPE